MATSSPRRAEASLETGCSTSTLSEILVSGREPNTIKRLFVITELVLCIMHQYILPVGKHLFFLFIKITDIPHYTDLLSPLCIG